VIRFIVILPAVCVLSARGYADVQTFENDYEGFAEVAGPLSVIDFETDPNGDPPQTGDELTETFNYDEQGIHFSAGYPYPPWPYPMFSSVGPYDLTVMAPTFGHTWIIGEFTVPALAIGGFFGGDTTLCAFDEVGTEIACVTYGSGENGNFVGIVSPDPIHAFTFDDGDWVETIHSVEFSPVPEPGTLLLMGAGAALLLRWRGRS